MKKTLPIDLLEENKGQIDGVPANPRTITKENMERLKKSLQTDPAMLELRGLLVAPHPTRGGYYVVVGGNMRLKALKALGYKEVPCEVMDDLEKVDPAKRKELIIRRILADNADFGDYDQDTLANEFDEEILDDYDLLPAGQAEDKEEDEAHELLSEKFLVPPMSVLDTRQGYWQDRLRAWHKIYGDAKAGESREETLFKSGNIIGDSINTVSIFDMTLAEVLFSWFIPNDGEPHRVFDPFMGDTVKAFVADYLGNYFTGTELRKEQVEVNKKKIAEKKMTRAKCIEDDGQNIAKHLQPASQDLMFSYPPYYDLEHYSDDPLDASNQESYEEFRKILDNAFTAGAKLLKDNRFAVVVMSNVRGKDGAYYDICGDITKIMERNGLKLYNEIILVNVIGTASMRAGNYMKNRKVARVHQEVMVYYKGEPRPIPEDIPESRQLPQVHDNVLVFYKGDQKNIAPEFREVAIGNLEEEELEQ